MDAAVSRRDTVRQLGLASVGVSLLAGRVGGQRGAQHFRPPAHAFGFRNWSSRRHEFATQANDPSPREVFDTVRSEWAEPARSVLGLDLGRFVDPVVEIISDHLHETIVQRAGSNGHCYGMALTAQLYHERPERIPVDRPSAARIEHPMVPFEEPVAPVHEDIVDHQAAQYLNFRTWLGRRAILWPDRIDVAAQLRDVKAVVDELGTATVTLVDGRQTGHQVLVYGYRDTPTGTHLSMYDPNHKADEYRSRTLELEVEQGSDGPRFVPYGRYSTLLFNRFDRIEVATGRTASPLDHLDLGVDRLREGLFPVGLVTVTNPHIRLTVLSAAGRVIDRIRSVHMDRSRGIFPRLRFGYGLPNGSYRIQLTTDRAATYTLRSRFGDAAGVLLDASVSDDIEAGEVHRYLAHVPADPDERGSLEPDRGGFDPLAVAAAGGGVAVGAGAYYLYQRGRSGGDADA